MSPTLLGSGLKSLLDSPEFFLAPGGKVSAQAELEATLQALFLSSETHHKAIACRFPARLAWLRKVLSIDNKTLPEYECRRLNNWLAKLGVDSLTLIFPVSVLNSPASMFGHTFLRLDRKAAKQPDLLAWTVNFAAHSEGEGGVPFAFNGLFGGYPGRFTLAHYYERVKAYSDIENRDIWEYELNYSASEVHFMLLHLWELLPVYFEYYFIDENCSYHLLALLEAARSDLHLTRSFYWDATPAATVRAVVSVPGLLKKVNYRPSLRRDINASAKLLVLPDQKMAKGLALGEMALNADVLLNKPGIERVRILELAAKYLAYQQARSWRPANKKQGLLGGGKRNDVDERLEQQRSNRLFQLLTERSGIALELSAPVIKRPDYRPDQGHSSHRMALRYGSESSEQYMQFDWRWAYHDAYDPDSGFVEGSQLAFLKPALRFYPAKNNWQIEELSIVDIVSTPTRNYFIRPISWQASAAMSRYDFDSDRPLLGDFTLGAGLSAAWGKGVTASIFTDAQLLVGDEFDDHIALGFGASADLSYTLTTAWKGGIHLEVMQYIEGVSQTAYQLAGKLRLSANKDSAALLEVSTNRQFSDSFLQAEISWQYYF